MYKQGLKLKIRAELMRIRTNISTLDRLTKEVIRLNNELFKLCLEERSFYRRNYLIRPNYRKRR